jgi:hypoxanthine phosphoribosyltransferase
LKNLPAHYSDFIDEIIIDEDTLQNRISELGKKISQDYERKDLLLICILSGGVLFLTDLMRNLTIPHSIDFMAVSSYGAGVRQSTGRVRINYDLKSDIYNRDVLLVEDIIDSGYTLKTVLEMLETRRPNSLRICTLLDKAERREVEIPIDYCGFVIPDLFVFGYGLDLDEYYRNLPFIASVDTSQYHPPE